MKIGFVGATHLGICYSAAISEKGFKVTCYDSDFALIQNLNNLQIPFYEKGLKKYFKKRKLNLHLM